jgi:hypothetical protein
MTEQNGHGADPKYAKAKKWSLKKIEKALDDESKNVSLTGSMIRKNSDEVQSLIQKSSDLIGESHDQESLNQYIQGMTDKALKLELINIEHQIKSMLIMKMDAERRLLVHKASKDFLMYQIRSKNQ